MSTRDFRYVDTLTGIICDAIDRGVISPEPVGKELEVQHTVEPDIDVQFLRGLVPAVAGGPARCALRWGRDEKTTRGGPVPKYLLQVNYTLDGVKGVLAKGGSARKAAAQAAAESAGGKVESFYFAFGSTDVYVVADLPDNSAAAALALTVTAGGGATVATTVLLTPDELDQATAAKVKYQPPGS